MRNHADGSKTLQAISFAKPGLNLDIYIPMLSEMRKQKEKKESWEPTMSVARGEREVRLTISVARG
jgi:hypothetical protein